MVDRDLLSIPKEGFRITKIRLIGDSGVEKEE